MSPVDEAAVRGAPDVRESVTVAVASFRALPLLEACLDSVSAQARDAGARTVVARPLAAGERESLSGRHPTVELVPAPAGAGVPELRGLALDAAGAGPVALTEDHCVASSDWLARLLAGLREGAEVVGGAMGNARTDKAVDWGAYFAEYGFFGPRASVVSDGVPSPTAANVAYAAPLVRRVSEAFRAGAWENVVHDRLRAAGASFAFDPRAEVRQNQRYRLAAFCADRFAHGRAYARDRLAEEGTRRRWLLAAGTALLPAVLASRVARAAGAAHRRAFVRALPFTLCFLGAWAVGELAGYLAGPSREESP